jgi:hypothetical protein
MRWKTFDFSLSCSLSADPEYGAPYLYPAAMLPQQHPFPVHMYGIDDITHLHFHNIPTA